MCGNVDEWCNTAMRPYPYHTNDGRENVRSMGRRAIRGGDFYSGLSSAMRRNAPSDLWEPMWGFRVALSGEITQAHQAQTATMNKSMVREEAEYRAAIAAAPHEPQPWYEFGTWLEGLEKDGVQRFVEATAALSQAIKRVNPPKWQFWQRPTLKVPIHWLFYNRAKAAFELQQYEQALPDVSQAIQLDPTDVDGYMLRARIASLLGQWAQVKKDLAMLRSLNHSFDHPHVILVQCHLLAGEGQYQAALNLIKGLIRECRWVTFRHPKLYQLRARVNAALGDHVAVQSDEYHFKLWSQGHERAEIKRQE